MVYGTIGPLLHEPRLQYVKGYYQRPIVADGVLKEGGGGRVTELVARPLINLFFPELSGLIQPLAGEYAGRRTLLETIPFFTGYAVEIGHLIDAAERVGIEGLGQVDLERRVHRNQELEGLSRMSFVILQAVMKRLEERRKVRLFAEMGSTMKLPRSGRGRLALEVIELADQERPPMIRIPEYLERRRALGPRPSAGSGNGTRRRERRARAGRRPVADRSSPVADAPLTVLFAPGLVQGLADLGRGRPGARRRLGPGPAATTSCCCRRSPTAARGRSSRSRRPAAGRSRRRASTTRCGARSRRAGCGRPTARARSSRWPRRPGCRGSGREERDPIAATTRRDRGAASDRRAGGGVADHRRDRRQRDDRRRRGHAGRRSGRRRRR